MQRLSQFLLDEVKELDEGMIKEAPPDEQADIAEWVAKKWISYLLQSIEGFSDKTASGIEAAFCSTATPWSGNDDKHTRFEQKIAKGLREYFENEFDEYYTRNLLESVPKMVARTMRLSRMVPRKMPSSAVNLYLRESTRSYIFGFWSGSIALARAAVEQGLRESLRDRLGRGATKFSDLLLASTRLRPPLVDKVHEKLASQVASCGNRVLHGQPSVERDAWDTSVAARRVLDHLYGAKGNKAGAASL
jgi:hypothetical protein